MAKWTYAQIENVAVDVRGDFLSRTEVIDIPYEWSDTIVNGYIAVDESEIDEVNEIDLQESNIVTRIFWLFLKY